MISSYVKLLVESEDPIDTTWKIITKIWEPSDDLREYFRREVIASNFEYDLIRVFFEVYRYLYDRVRRVPRKFQPPLMIVDGMSVREGNLLIRDLERRGYKVLRYSYSFSALPSNTSTFRGLFTGRYIEIKHGEVPSHIDPTITIWISYPDEILHHAGKIVKPPEAYEKTRDAIFKALDSIVESCVLTITSDHGYIMVDEIWPISRDIMKFLKSIFGKSRFIKLEEIEKSKLKRLRNMPEEKSCVFMDDEYCYVKGRYFWPISGYRSVISHGGLSLMECMVPLIEVRI